MKRELLRIARDLRDYRRDDDRRVDGCEGQKAEDREKDSALANAHPSVVSQRSRR